MPEHKPPPSNLKPPPQVEHSALSPKLPTTVGFDWQDWVSYLDEMDGTEDQMREYVEIVWTIVMAFIDLGYEVKSNPKPCGQNLDLTAALRAAVVKLKEQKQLEETQEEFT